MKTPYFTVIIPTHKRSLLLHRALTSIKAQNLPAPLEIIVISDAADSATDQVCHVLLSEEDKYIRRNGPAGPSESRNLGLSLAKGQHILFLDDDDAWHPGLLEHLYGHQELAQGNPVYFNCSVVTESRLPEGPQQISEHALDLSGKLNELVYVKNQVHMSCFAFPKNLLNGLQFDPFMRAYEDWDFCLSVFDRQMPVHTPFLGSRVFEVHDETTDRRGNNPNATGWHAILDYVYVYRRHPVINEELKSQRANLLQIAGMNIPKDFL